jgi:hypothetical protein
LTLLWGGCLSIFFRIQWVFLVVAMGKSNCR